MHVVVAVLLLARGIEFAGRLKSLQRLGGHLQTITALVMIGAGVWLTLAGLVG